MNIIIILLWVFMIAQMITMFYLVKFVVDFLNRFRIEHYQNDAGNLTIENKPIQS